MELLIKRVLDTLAEVGESERVALLTLQSEGFCTVDGGFAKGEFIETGKTISYLGTPLEAVIAEKKPLTYPGILRNHLPFPAYEENENHFECLCLPLFDEDDKEIIGIAVIAQNAEAEKPDYRMQTLTMLRTLVSAAMENARLFQLATMDSLTGLYMRRYFEIRLQEEMLRVRRHGYPLSLLMVDIDYFKQINDTYGHQQGDKVLQEVSQILIDSVRADIDLPCRYGGEEFILLLPSTPLDGAFILGDRIREKCEKHLFHTDENHIRVTVSIGVAQLSQDDRISKEELIQHADLMLYEAKRSGRNRVMKYVH